MKPQLRLRTAAAAVALLVGISASFGATSPLAECDESRDWKEEINNWPDRWWHAEEGTTAPLPDDWQPNGEFIPYDVWPVVEAHAHYDEGLTASHCSWCG